MNFSLLKNELTIVRQLLEQDNEKLALLKAKYQDIEVGDAGASLQDLYRLLVEEISTKVL